MLNGYLLSSVLKNNKPSSTLKMYDTRTVRFGAEDRVMNYDSGDLGSHSCFTIETQPVEGSNDKTTS